MVLGAIRLVKCNCASRRGARTVQLAGLEEALLSETLLADCHVQYGISCETSKSRSNSFTQSYPVLPSLAISSSLSALLLLTFRPLVDQYKHSLRLGRAQGLWRP